MRAFLFLPLSFILTLSQLVEAKLLRPVSDGLQASTFSHLKHHRRTNENSQTEESSWITRFVADGVVDLGYNPAYVVTGYNEFYDGPSLIVTSFHNVALNPGNNTMPFVPFYRDLASLVKEIDAEDPRVVELTDVNSTPPFDTVWPNNPSRVPGGVFPFAAVILPQGWFAVPQPGRLVVIDLETLQEYVIHQSTNDEPRFYHYAIFVDLDQDGLADILTVRSGFKVMPTFSPPVGELVLFKNPGPDALQADVEWEEHVLVGGMGPDVSLDAKDLDGDGVPEIVATHFFAGLANFVGTPWGKPSTLSLYGAPLGQTWAAVVNASDPASPQPRSADILTDQGMIFDVELVDLDGDGRIDVLATNHQTNSDPIPGRVFALEQPASGLLFEDEWTMHILMDNINATDSLSPVGPQRMAPGKAEHFYPTADDDKPWIVLSGDEASKVWILKPTNDTWVYESEMLFGINEYYGENTTQTPLEDPFGITISTIGGIAIREKPEGVVLYVPVFEATDIHIFGYSGSVTSFGVATGIFVVGLQMTLMLLFLA